jgi:ribosome biogenesis protein Tsr3
MFICAPFRIQPTIPTLASKNTTQYGCNQHFLLTAKKIAAGLSFSERKATANEKRNKFQQGPRIDTDVLDYKNRCNHAW